MSIQHVAAVLDLPRDTFRSTGQRFVLVVLANHVNDAGRCWPRVATVAREAGQSDGAARRHCETLVEDGWIEKLHRRRRKDGTLGSWVYRLDVERLGRPLMVDDEVFDEDEVEALDPEPDEGDQRAPVSSGDEGTSAHPSRIQRAPVDEPARTGARAVTISDPSPEPAGEDADSVDVATPPPTELVPLKERNRAALAKLPKSVDPQAVQNLCTRLSDRLTQHHPQHRRPTITPQWVKDMGTLLNTGPKGYEGRPPSIAEVETMIDMIFDRLATPEGRGFCWADNIQSPTKLREQWGKVELALAKQRGAGQPRDLSKAADVMQTLRGAS